jgi:hypothetical protein
MYLMRTLCYKMTNLGWLVNLLDRFWLFRWADSLWWKLAVLLILELTI